MRRLSCLIVALLLGFISTTAVAAELVANPEYQSWSRFAAGTIVRYTQQADMGGMKMNMQFSNRLVEINAEQATVETEIRNPMLPEGGQRHSRVIPARIAASTAEVAGIIPDNMEGEVKKLDNEKIKVGNSEIDAEVYRFTGREKQHQMAFEGRFWVSSTIPGMIVKFELKSTGDHAMTMTMTLTEIVKK